MRSKGGDSFPVTVTGLKVKLTQQFRQMCEGKLHSLSRIFNHIESGTVAIRRERGFYIAEITLLLSGLKMRSEERERSMRVAFDSAFGAIKEQLRRFKEKLYDRHRRSSVVAAVQSVRTTNPNQIAQSQQAAKSQMIKIKRVKRFESKPMRIDEAALQMELLGHDFFVFINAETGRVNVIYRRRDGSYGIIELV
ncbi:MAG: ribosome-associated translation inhibitor RaiA [Armatimonadota bacterium]|nr:ribosome-associated translation inhibitor RaiA [Armatimonadota bacterium]MCX7778202.1 ribosome-associated translation inhibitor RaiA [Armatimonadota bacterium]MDW8025684.1 ribosome-associated translation inhibitor RaiA [Armatimonadota bacterium]